MASYAQLQSLVKECIDQGLVKKGLSVKALKAVFKERTKDKAVLESRYFDPSYRWGASNRSHERQVDFFNECAKQVYNLPSWPIETVGEKAPAKDVKRAQALGVAVDDLPHVAEATKAGELENYLKVCSLTKKKHLPLRFYLDLVAGGAREVEGAWLDDPKQLAILYAIARTIKRNGFQMAEALRRQKSSNKRCSLDDLAASVEIPESELPLWYEFNRNVTAYHLFKAGAISHEFAVRYGFHLTADWRRCKKITENPAWDLLRYDIALALYRGRAPQKIAADKKIFGQPMDLTQKEAGEWIQLMIDTGKTYTPKEFLVRKYSIDKEVGRKFRSVTRVMLEWYSRKKDLTSMNKQRVMHGPGGQSKHFRFNDILDEITEADLGPADAPLAEKLNANPEKVFAAAARRLNDLYLAKLGSSVKLPRLAQVKVPFDGVRQLCGSNELITEGKEMGHCVGGYIDACLKKISYIFSVTTDAGRSTFEVCNLNGYCVTQHYGPNNRMPPEANCELVLAWSTANGILYRYQPALQYAA